MCGIVGFVGPGDRDDLALMMEALAHRGPDGEGTHSETENRLHLGHLRLSIIDPAGGAQPMWNAARSVGVVFNGEIYNHRELRKQLEGLGHCFLTDHSDTEVLIHGYAQWGEDLPLHLNGQFAFAIYDRIRQRLFFARDRMGEKPLYIARQNGLFAFASELSAIARHRAFQARLSHRSLQKFFAYGYIPAPNAVLEDCEKLPAGGAMSFDISTGTERRWRYWQFRLEPDDDWEGRPDEDLAAELRAHLFEAVRRRLVSDVPLGFFLSGGIDSSAILAGAAQHLSPEQIKCFTIGFTEPSFDESAQASSVAGHFHAFHAIEWLELERAKDLVPAILARLDEPLGDASILPTYLLSEFTRRHVTVALSGDGGDELFAGYDPFSALAPARLYHAFVPRPLHVLLREAVHRLPVSTRNMSLDFRLRRTLTGLSYDPSLWNPVWMSPADPKLIAHLFEESLTPEELYSEALDVWAAGGTRSLVDRTLEFYTNFYLPDDILMKVDRASMMVSLESRAVFLDNDVVRFCQKLPNRFKMRGKSRKYLLKKALKGVLPDSVLHRPKKGFGVPTASWLRSLPKEPPLAPLAGMNMTRIANAWDEHRRGMNDHRLLLWSWLSLQSLRYGPAA